MNNKRKWIKAKKRLFAAGTALGLAFADFDPSTPPPEFKQILHVDEASGDNKDKK